ncbi:FANCI solenoid 1-domain-containing protein, partial [Blyttiomyces helicus]
MQLREIFAARLRGRDVSDALSLLRSIFADLPPDSDKILIRKGGLLRCVMECHCSGRNPVHQRLATAPTIAGEGDDKVVSDIVSLLNSEVDKLAVEDVVEFTELLRTSVCDRKTVDLRLFDFLPKLLHMVAALDAVVVNDGTEHAETKPGPEWRDEVIGRICNCKWIDSTAIPIATAFMDIPLTESQLHLVVMKLLRKLADIDLKEAPRLVRELLLLSKKGAQLTVVNGISKFFTSRRGHSSEEGGSPNPLETDTQLAKIEGTIIVQICYAMKQDQTLGNEFLKHMKATKTRHLTTFNIALLLGMARTLRFEAPINEYLKSSILKCFKDAQRIPNATWLAAHDEFQPIDIAKRMHDILANAFQGWEHVIQSTVALALILLDAGGGGAFGRVAAPKAAADRTPSDMCCTLGGEMLLETFRTTDIVRATILREIFSRVLSRSPSATAALDLLENITATCPHLLLSHLHE